MKLVLQLRGEMMGF